MTTLAVMKARIATEMRRADLTDQIAAAITTAIAAYQSERFIFSESLATTFNTVAGQQNYTSAAHSNIPNLYAIDYVAMTVGSTVTMLDRYDQETIDDLTNNQSAVGEPYAYSYYNFSINLYPIPGQVYPVRIAAHILRSVPLTDEEAGNPWMTSAERLIRSRAKLELGLHVTFDDQLVARMATAIAEAESELKGRSNRQVAIGRIVPTQF